MTRIIDCVYKIRKEVLNSSFSTSLRTINELSVIELHIRTDDGFEVYGETVETPAITGDTAAAIMRDIDSIIAPAVVGQEFTSAVDMFKSFIEQTDTTNSSKAAADMAFLELESAIRNMDLKQLLNCNSTAISSDVTVPICELADIASLIDARDGFSAFKVKLGAQDFKFGIEKIRIIQDLIGPDSIIRIDPNQAWTVEQSIEFLQLLETNGLKIEYLEQPIAASNRFGLAQIRKESNFPIMADESLFVMKDLEELDKLKAVDLVNIKILKCGGVTPAIELIKKCNDLGMKYSIGTMMEGDKGVFAAALVAAAHLPEYCHDLDAAWWIKDSQLIYQDGMVGL